VDAKGEAVAAAMVAYFGSDAKRIDHARRVTGYAEQLCRTEGGEPRVVIAAALLHDIGIHEAERKYRSTAGKYQEIEGPPIARRILTGLSFEAGDIDEVCEIIAHHHSPGRITTKNFSIICDADWLVNLPDEHDIHDRERVARIVAKVFRTAAGKKLARRLFLHQD
jgi:hypothetical protein